MPAISNKEVFVFSSSKYGVIGVYNSFKSFTEQGLKPLHKKYLKSEEEIMISLLNKGEYHFGNGMDLYKLKLCKQANIT